MNFTKSAPRFWPNIRMISGNIWPQNSAASKAKVTRSPRFHNAEFAVIVEESVRLLEGTESSHDHATSTSERTGTASGTHLSHVSHDLPVAPGGKIETSVFVVFVDI